MCFSHVNQRTTFRHPVSGDTDPRAMVEQQPVTVQSKYVPLDTVISLMFSTCDMSDAKVTDSFHYGEVVIVLAMRLIKSQF